MTISPVLTTSILIVDKNNQASAAVAAEFIRSGYQVLCADSGRSALRIVEEHGLPDLAIVDTNLKYRMSGFEFCRNVQRYSDLPIIMTSDQQDPVIAAYAIENFAEDFISKPFDARVIVVRTRRLLARFRTHINRNHPVRVDFPNREVFVEDQIVKLTPTEAKLLHILLRHPDETLSTDYIMRRLWPSDPLDPCKLRVNVYRLRSKIGQAGNDMNFIHSERGVGYGWMNSEVVA